MAFTIRRDAPIQNFRSARSTSVVDSTPVSIHAREGVSAGNWVEVFQEPEEPVLENKRGWKRKKNKHKKKTYTDDASDEDLHIEFAELLGEPRTQYCPALHGWREWQPRGEWIDPEEVRQDAVNILQDGFKRLPTKPTGPPLP